MNQLINTCLLAGDKFMPEMDLKQPVLLDKSRFTYSACGTFSKNKEIIQKFKETGDTKCVYRNELNKDFMQLDVVREILQI